MPEVGGIPWIERQVGKMLIRKWCKKHPPSETIYLVREQRDELASLISQAGANAIKRVTIKRLRGMEASSTDWSLAMVADHCARVNVGIANTVLKLVRNESIDRTVVIADFKPTADVEIELAVESLDDSVTAIQDALEQTDAIMAANATHAHPWFGELPAHVWACFPSFHQSVHLEQARRIHAGLG